MAFAGHEFTGPASHGPSGSLPDRVRCLFMTTSRRTGAWLAEALAADSATRVHLEQASTPGEGLARLGEQVFDAVLLSHEPGQLDALEIVEGLRAGGNEEPLIVLGAASEAEMSPLSFEVGADAYVCVATATTRGLLWLVARAIEHRQLLRENRRLRQAEQHRLQHEQREAEHLLSEQRILVKTWYEYSAGGADECHPAERTAEQREAGSQAVSRLPEPLTNHYRDLLRRARDHGLGQSAARYRPVGRSADSSGGDGPGGVAIAHRGAERDDPRTGQSQCPACDDPGRHDGPGTVATTLRRISAAIRACDDSATVAGLATLGRVIPRHRDGRGLPLMSDQQTTIDALKRLMAEFVAERDWQQFHTPKNLSMALAIEAAELMEHFQWLTPTEAAAVSQDPAKLTAVGEELADVVCYALALANSLGLDLSEIVQDKMRKNISKYPAAEFRGRWARGIGVKNSETRGMKLPY